MQTLFNKISQINDRSTTVQRPFNKRSTTVKLESISSKIDKYQSLIDTADENYRNAMSNLESAKAYIDNVDSIMGEVDGAVEEIESTLATINDLGIDVDVPLDQYSNDLKVLQGIDPADSKENINNAISNLNKWL